MSLKTIVSKMIAANEPESNIAKVIRYHKKDSSKINCEKCDHSWKVADGGNDLYTCHECGYNNNKNSPLKAIAICPDGSEPDEFGKCNEDKELSSTTEVINEDIQTPEDEKILRAKRDNKVGVMGSSGNLVSKDKDEVKTNEEYDKWYNEFVQREGEEPRVDEKNKARERFGLPIDNSMENIQQSQLEIENQALDEVIVTGEKPKEDINNTFVYVEEAFEDAGQGEYIKVQKADTPNSLTNTFINLAYGVDENAQNENLRLENNAENLAKEALKRNPFIKDFIKKATEYNKIEIQEANQDVNSNLQKIYSAKADKIQSQFNKIID